MIVRTRLCKAVRTNTAKDTKRALLGISPNLWVIEAARGRLLGKGREELLHFKPVSLDPVRVRGNQRELFEAEWGTDWSLDPYYNTEISVWEPYRWRHAPVGRVWYDMGLLPGPRDDP